MEEFCFAKLNLSPKCHLYPAERCFNCDSIPQALFWQMLFSVLFRVLHTEVNKILHCCIFGPVLNVLKMKWGVE